MAGKLAKADVDYRQASGPRHCGNCVMFRAGGTCTLVAGAIYPADVCDRWSPE